jgi:acyl-CoA thioesterase-1
LILYPFFLDGVAADASLNLADRIHPNRRGVEVIVERMLPTVERFVRGLKVAG